MSTITRLTTGDEGESARRRPVSYAGQSLTHCFSMEKWNPSRIVAQLPRFPCAPVSRTMDVIPPHPGRMRSQASLLLISFAIAAVPSFFLVGACDLLHCLAPQVATGMRLSQNSPDRCRQT